MGRPVHATGRGRARAKADARASAGRLAAQSAMIKAGYSHDMNRADPPADPSAFVGRAKKTVSDSKDRAGRFHDTA